jgi:hypothetical protein
LDCWLWGMKEGVGVQRVRHFYMHSAGDEAREQATILLAVPAAFNQKGPELIYSDAREGWIARSHLVLG